MILQHNSTFAAQFYSQISMYVHTVAKGVAIRNKENVIVYSPVLNSIPSVCRDGTLMEQWSALQEVTLH